MNKNLIKRRLSWYYPVERINAFVIFPMIALYHLSNHSIKDIFALVYGLSICIFILYQGQHYWKIKLYRLTGKPVDQSKILSRFRLWKRINEYMIAAIPLVLLVWFYLEGWMINSYSIFYWTIGVNAFAILEYINYYHWQITIDKVSDLTYVLKNKKLKTAHLGKDLKENVI